jgi:hypothetical protein
MKFSIICIVSLLLCTSCQYVFVQTPSATSCKDPIYSSAYNHADEIVSYLPSTVADIDKAEIRSVLVNKYLERYGANNPLDAQMDARKSAMNAFYNKFGTCPMTVTSGPLGNGYFVTLSGVDGKKWNYDTTTPGTLTESKW